MLDKVDLKILQSLSGGPKQVIVLAAEVTEISERTIWNRLKELKKEGLVKNGISFKAERLSMKFWRLTKIGRRFA